MDIEKLLVNEFPDRGIFSFATVSNESYFEYSLIKQGELVRRHRGDQVKILEDVGDLLPQEKTWFDKSFMRDGIRYVPYENALFGKRDVSLHMYGEDLVGIAALPYFGYQFFPPKPFRFTADLNPKKVESGEMTREEFFERVTQASKPGVFPELELFELESNGQFEREMQLQIGPEMASMMINLMKGKLPTQDKDS